MGCIKPFPVSADCALGMLSPNNATATAVVATQVLLMRENDAVMSENFILITSLIVEKSCAVVTIYTLLQQGRSIMKAMLKEAQKRWQARISQNNIGTRCQIYAW